MREHCCGGGGGGEGQACKSSPKTQDEKITTRVLDGQRLNSFMLHVFVVVVVVVVLVVVVVVLVVVVVVFIVFPKIFPGPMYDDQSLIIYVSYQ